MEQRCALNGIKVIELTQWAAGPSAAAVLADWGADVIKIERIDGGDPMRGIAQVGVFSVGEFNHFFEVINRGKRSVALDVRSDLGREVMLKLIEKGDVFLTNIRSQFLDTYGYDYDTLSKVNPRLIYCQVTGYGTEGPGKNWPAMDETGYWASSGIMAILGEPDEPPPPLRGAMGDLPTGMFSAGSIALALYYREKTGIGQKIDTSLLNSGCWVVGFDLQTALSLGEDNPRESRKERNNALYNSYKTKDKRWIMLCMPQAPKYWPDLCKALGRPELIDDPRFATDEDRLKNRSHLLPLLDEIIGGMTLPEIRERFTKDDVDLVWAPVQLATEVAKDPNVVLNKYVVEFDHPSAGKQKMVATPARFSETPAMIRGPAPTLGQHTEEVLLELDYDWDKIGELKDKKAII